MSWAQSNAVFLSPGIKLSHAFGEDGGFVFGIELSCYREIGPPGKDLDFAGFLCGVDWGKNQTKIQLALEGSHRFVGFSIGPSLILNQAQNRFGITGTLYSWFIVLPYYGYTYVFDNPDIHELGLYVKIPLQISGRRFFDFRVGRFRFTFGNSVLSEASSKSDDNVHLPSYSAVVLVIGRIRWNRMVRKPYALPRQKCVDCDDC